MERKHAPSLRIVQTKKRGSLPRQYRDLNHDEHYYPERMLGLVIVALLVAAAAFTYYEFRRRI
jgi:hypothetical protein